MRYLLKQKLFSFGDGSFIRDEEGRDVFRVDGKVFTIGHKFWFQGTGRPGAGLYPAETARLEPDPRDLPGRPTGRRDQERAVHLLSLPLLAIDLPGPDDLAAEGDFLDYEYSLTRGGRIVATVSKKWFAWADTYAVEVAEGEDAVLILAATVVIDMVCHDDDH